MPRKPPAPELPRPELPRPELPSLHQGGLIGIEPDGIVGWARDANHPDLPVQVLLMAGGQVVGEALANQFDDARVRSLVGPGVAGFVARLRLAPSGRYPLSLSLHDTSGQTLGPPLPVHAPTDLAGVVGLDPPATFEGHMDGVHAGALMGWARDLADPDRALELELFDTGTLLARATANRPREDLRSAGLHHGLYGFSFDLPVSLLDGKPHSLSVRVAGTGFTLHGGPIGFGPLATSALMTQMAALQAETTALRQTVNGLTAPDGPVQRRILRTLAERMAAQAEIQREQLEREMEALRAMVFAAADRGAGPTPEHYAPPPRQRRG
jgi:hypothetical protein